MAYPKKANLVENHHIKPQYLGGPVDGPTVPLNGAYHQQITNAFRNQWGYGQAKPDPATVEEMMKEVYRMLPLPPK